MSASCNRVAVIDGHTVSVSIKLRKPATHESCWLHGRSSGRSLECIYRPPPRSPLSGLRKTIVRSHASIAIAATAWRSRWADCALCPVLDWKFTVLSHNTMSRCGRARPS